MDVFVDVDVQRDFCEPDGALSVAGSPNDLFRELTKRAMAAKAPIVGSVDSHAYDAWEFASNDNVGPDGEDPRFPDHCVKGTLGWLKVQGTLVERFRFVPNVADGPTSQLVEELRSGASQALYFEKEVYSMFANPLAERAIAALVQGADARFIVYGVATDYCVKAAALGLAERGYETVVLTDAIAAVAPAGGQQALEQMRAAGIQLARSQELF